MVNIQIHTGDLIPPIQSLENYFWNGGVSIIRAAFAHSYFVHPDAVRERTPYYPNRARRSGNHYPGLDKGKHAIWPEDGREVILDVNLRAHQAWERYTGRKLLTRTAYGVRHIWGHPWNPDAFTAGWNLCYMPFWAGMPTEDQHPHPELRDAIKQASWDLYFRDDPVCPPPDFVANPGLDLQTILGGQPLLILTRDATADVTPSGRASTHDAVLPISLDPSPAQVFKEALLRTKQAWIVIAYEDGREEVRLWDADRISSSSNIIGNLRSRSTFRAGAWQQNGITSVRVSIDKPIL